MLSMAENSKAIGSSVLAEDDNIDNDELQPRDINADIEGPNHPLLYELEGTLDAIKNVSLFSNQHGEEISSLVIKMQFSLATPR